MGRMMVNIGQEVHLLSEESVVSSGNLPELYSLM